MNVWKVSYHDIRTRDARHPFWKKVAYVAAATRKEAIERLSASFGPPNYGNYRASKTDQPADYFFN